MAKVFAHDEDLVNISNAINEKLDTEIDYTITQMAPAINSMNPVDNLLADYCDDTLVTFAMNNLSEVPNNAFVSFNTLESVYLPDTTTIGNYAFNNCTNLTAVNLPEATTLGKGSFEGCSSLTSISIPKVTSIVDGDNWSSAFRNCTSLQSITFPELRYIGTCLFYSCTSLQSITAPKATSISPSSIIYCSSLQEIILPGPTLCELSYFFDNGCPTNMNIYVPANLVDSYKSHNYWRIYADHIFAISE